MWNASSRGAFQTRGSALALVFLEQAPDFHLQDFQPQNCLDKESDDTYWERK